MTEPMTPCLAIPDAPAYRLTNLRTPLPLAPELEDAPESDVAPCELVIDGGRLAHLGPPGSAPADGLPTVDGRGGLVPLLFPIVLTPVVGVTVIAVAARNGWWLPVVAAAVGAIPLAVAAVGAPLARRQWRLLSASIGAVVGVVMIVDGALAV